MKTILFILINDKYMTDYSGEWIGVAYISAALKKQNLVNVECCFCDKENIGPAIRKCKEIRPAFVGFPVLTFNYHAVRKCVQEIKEQFPEIIVTLGHRESTKLREKILEDIRADIAVIGEGEITNPEIVKTILNNQSLKGVKGICYRTEDGTIIVNEPREDIVNLDTINFPDRSIIAPNDRHHHYVNYIITTRGCKGNCSFCDIASDLHRRKKVYARSIGNIMEEIESILQKNASSYIAFGDDSFEDGDVEKCKRYNDLYEEILKRGLKFNFSFNARAESITEESVVYLNRLKEVGLDKIFIGIDSGNTEDLRLYRKRATLENNIKAVELLNANDISFDYGFIMFNPYTSFDKLEENIEFLEKNKLEIKSHVLAHRFVLYTGAPMLAKIKNDDLLDEKKFINKEPFCYGFKEKGIQETWEILHELRDWPANRDTISMVMGFINSLKRENPNDENVKQFSEKYIEFVNISNKVFVQVFRYVLTQFRQEKYFNLEYLKRKFGKEFELVKEKWNELYKINLKNGVLRERNNRHNIK
jgi:Fe-S oxidoreductase